jgi:hypothetical protein
MNKNQATTILDTADKVRDGELKEPEIQQSVGPKLWAVIESLGGFRAAVKEAQKQWPMLA